MIIDNEASNRHTMIQLRGIDRSGLLFDVTWQLAKLNLNIVSAHVVSYGEKAIDTFYVTDLTNAKITDESRQRTLRQALTAVLQSPERPAPSVAAP